MHKKKFYYCPECGYVVGDPAIVDKCMYCKSSLLFRRKLIQITDPEDIAELGKDIDKIRQMMYVKDKYLVNNPIFNEDKFNKRIQEDKELSERVLREYEEKMRSFEALPKCPTCGSRRISKISTASRAASTITFGLASNKIGKQFHCDNCGYNW